MTVPSMFSMNSAVAMMRAVKAAERMASLSGAQLLAPQGGRRKARRKSPGHKPVKAIEFKPPL